MLLKDLSQQKLLSHSGRCFDIRFSIDGSCLLTASEDGTAKLWDVKTRKAVLTFKHNKESEVLRAAFLNSSSTLVATCGADGFATVWKTFYDGDVTTETHKLPDKSEESPNGVSAQVASGTSVVGNQTGKRRLKKEITLTHGVAQIYACECFNVNNEGNSAFMTAADSSVYLWDLNAQIKANDNSSSHVWTVRADSDDTTSSSPSSDCAAQGYGGPRNPDNEIYIFDAKINPHHQNIIALALSDGNIRQIDIRTAGFINSASTSAPFAPLQNTSTSLSRSKIGNSSPNPCNDEDSDLPIFDSISLTGSAGNKERVGNAHATSVCYSDDGLTLLAALGVGDVAVLDLRMGGVRTLLRSHTRTCYGAVFNTPLESFTAGMKNSISESGSGSSSSGTKDGIEFRDRDKSADDDEDKGDVTQNARLDQLRLNEECEESSSATKRQNKNSSKEVNRNHQCLTWSSDCSVRSWDISVDGLCTQPIDEVFLPDFPIFSFALNGQRKREFACGGGNGDASFVGTPVHLFYESN